MRKAAFALLTATFFGVATSDAPAREPTLAKGPGKRGALLVGVDVYESLPTLDYASADARKLRDALVEIGFTEEGLRLLATDAGVRERPSRERILKALDELLEESGPDSSVVVALSGRGGETENGDAAFCPEDVEGETEDGRVVVTSETAILIEDVKKRLAMDDAKFKLLIVDADRPATLERERGPQAPTLPTGLVVLYSCGAGERRWESDKLKGGVFMNFFAEGMRGAAGSDGDGGVSFWDVCGYALTQTSRCVAEKFNSRQTPTFIFDGVGDFWLNPPTKKRDGENDAAAKLAKANALLVEAFTAYNADDYATARSKCKASLAEAQTEAAQDLLKKIDAAQKKDDAAAKLAKANALLVEAFTLYNAGDYATARSKCKASLAVAQTTAAQDLLKKIDAAQQPQTSGTSETQPTSQPASGGKSGI